MASELNNLQKQPARLNIRIYNQDDMPDIIAILKDNNLYDENDSIEDFYILECGDIISGVVQVKPYESYLFLSYMAIRPDSQKKGYGAFLLKQLLPAFDKPVYLYTIIHEFYEKYGFRIIKQPEFLPPKDEDACRICIPEKCRTMIWSPVVS
jgi:N-acetylglutamate synthase-like GNAT family acetyltransferase